MFYTIKLIMQFTVIEVRLIPLLLVKEIPNLSSKKHTN